MADGQGENPKSGVYSKRVEEKYLIKKTDLDVIVNEIEDNLYPDYPEQGTNYTLVSSTYLDTPELKFLKQHIDDEPTRYKLRVRTYAPNGDWQADKYLEVKYKINGSNRKARIKIDQYSFTEIIGGKSIPDKTRKLNMDLDDQTYDQAVAVIEECSSNGVAPSVKVQYKRISYCNKHNTVRTTIDRNLQVDDYAIAKNFDATELKQSGKWAELKGWAMKYSDDRAVWEVKYHEDTEAPDWMETLTNNFKIGQPGFSKYLWALYTVLK